MEAPDSKYPEQHLKQLADAGLTVSQIRSPSEITESAWYEALQARARQTLALKYAKDPTASAFELSQSLARTTRQASSSAPSSGIRAEADNSLIPKSLVWVNSWWRLLVGYEHMLLQGLLVTAMPDVAVEPRNVCTGLAGNMLNAESLLAAAIPLPLHLPWDLMVDHTGHDGHPDEEFLEEIYAAKQGLYDACDSEEELLI